MTRLASVVVCALLSTTAFAGERSTELLQESVTVRLDTARMMLKAMDQADPGWREDAANAEAYQEAQALVASARAANAAGDLEGATDKAREAWAQIDPLIQAHAGEAEGAERMSRRYVKATGRNIDLLVESDVDMPSSVRQQLRQAEQAHARAVELLEADRTRAAMRQDQKAWGALGRTWSLLWKTYGDEAVAELEVEAPAAE